MATRKTMTWDILFKSATVFDGSERPPQVMDLAISDGRIAARGTDLDETRAAEVIDAEGLWLTPGLLDIHTHYDLEVEVDARLPESVRHGTTTVVMSNCSLGLAFGAQRVGGADPIVDCFARVENMPKHILSKVADEAEGWSNSAGYLDHLDALPLGCNVVPLVPHSMLRIEAMGFEDSIRRDPTSDELQTMCDLVEEAMKQGYPGFSTDALPFHYLANDPNRKIKIPTQHGTYAELKALTNVVREYEGVWQATPPKDNPPEILKNFLLTSGRLHGKPLRITAVAALDVVTNRSLGFMGRVLTRVLNSRLVDGNFRLQALAAPFKVWSEGAITPLSEEIPELRALNEPDLDDREARMRILADDTFRRDFRAMWYSGKKGFGLARLKRLLTIEDHTLTRDLDDMVIERCPVKDWSGESMGEIFRRYLAWQDSSSASRGEEESEAFERAAEYGVKDDCAFFLHLLKAFDTDLYWYTYAANVDPDGVRRLILDSQLLPGFSDSGAHITNMAFYDANLRALQIAARDGLETVAYMVKRLTREPAEFFGIDAGTIEVGDVADLALIDPDELSTYDAEANVVETYRDEFEHHQLVNRSDGVVPMVVVGGAIAWRDGEFSPDHGVVRRGRTLRSTRVDAYAPADQAVAAAAE